MEGRTVPEAVRRSLHAYVSDLALDVMSDEPASGYREVDGTLAFFDISGFTKLTERLARVGRSGAEHINDVLNTVFQGLIHEVFRRGGDVLEFGGDAMVVLFSGEMHERRAAAAATEMFRFMAHDGRIATPLGDARLRMSCGMATGTQAYYLLGTTRRALVVAGPVSTAMAQLEASANAGEALISDHLAAALPPTWVSRRESDGALRLRFSKVSIGNPQCDDGAREPTSVSDQLIARLLPTQFGSLLEGTHRAGELKQVAMSFIRLNGTDELLAQEGTDGVHRLLAEITGIVDKASADLDVCWLETQAEANSVRWTLIAGAPTATERDGERLLHVLRRIADETPAPLRIGANLGVVFVGDMGHAERCTYIVMGDATNLAARLMAKASPGQIIAGERLHKTCLGRFEVTPLEPFLVKGKKAPVQAYEVGPVADDDASGEIVRPDAAIPPIVGRDEELARLRELIVAGGFIELVGEAGVGKSRLWQEARRLETDRRWFVMRAEPHEIGSVYLPFRRLLRVLVGIEPHADESSIGTTIAAFVEQHCPALTPWLPLIATVVGGVVATTEEVEALDPAFRADRLHHVVAEFVVELTGAGSVIVFEDVHWIDEASRGLVDALASLLGHEIAFITTRRPQGWSPSPVTTITLDAIDNEFADQLLLDVLPASAASDAALARLRASAEGNPLYLIELARSVATTAARSDAEFPETVERVLAARIDQLPLTGRELIRDASVLGSSMSCALASRVLDRADLAGPDVWRLELGDLVTLDEDSVRFRHDLVRVAAYEGLSVRRRRALHRRAGDVIEEWGDAVPLADPVAALAFHATGSGLPERIVRWNSEAAEAAISKGAMEVAEALLRDVVSAHDHVGSDSQTKCATQRRLAYVSERAGHPEPALSTLAQAARLASDHDRALIAADRAGLLEKIGRYRSALVTTARALKSCPDSEASAHLRLTRAFVRNRLGHFEECLTLSRAVLADLEPDGDRRLRAQAHLLAEWCCMSLGLPERAVHDKAAFDLLVELNDSIGLANLLLNRGESAWRENRADDAVDDFRMSSEYYQRAGDVLGAALADNNVAEILTLQFRLDAAKTLLERARRVTQAANYPMGAFAAMSGLSRIAAWQGDVRAALDQQQAALDGFTEIKADELVVDSLARLTEIHVLAGDAAAALAAASSASAILAGLGDAAVVPAMLARLEARALLLDGRADEARVAFERALRLANDDGFVYEVALASMGLGRLDGDVARVSAAMAQLSELGVLAPPPGS